MSVTHSWPKTPGNTFKGSCRDFLKRVEKGAVDKDGNTHDGGDGNKLTGLNRVQITPSATYTNRRTVTGYHCSRNGVVYKTAADCAGSCSGGLAGPGGSCTPVEHQVTVTATASFSATVELYALEWETDCPAGKQANEKLRQHELRHLADIERRVEEWNKKRLRWEQTGEWSEQKPAQKDLDEGARRELEERARELQEQIDKDAEEFHQTEPGTRITLDCSQCP